MPGFLINGYKARGAGYWVLDAGFMVKKLSDDKNCKDRLL